MKNSTQSKIVLGIFILSVLGVVYMAITPVLDYNVLHKNVQINTIIKDTI